MSDAPRITAPPLSTGRQESSVAARPEDAAEKCRALGAKLSLLPIELAEANAFVERLHRHHRPVVGHKFSLGAARGNAIVGVCIVGRPVSRHRDDGATLEVTRLCTDGTRNACSFLYGAAARAAFALGYRRIGTYILASEPGSSLKAAGWRLIGERGGGRWTRSSRPRIDTHPTEIKLLFEAVA
jgi:hypothetical protein